MTGSAIEYLYTKIKFRRIMKKMFLAVLAIMIMASCSTNEHYVLKGNLEGAEGEFVYLKENSGGALANRDSTVIVNGSFEFEKGKVDVPSMYYLSVEGKRGSLGFFLENTEILISGHVDSLYNASIEGSMSQKLYDAYNDGLDPFYEKSSSLYQEYRAAMEEGNTELAEQISEQRKSVDQDIESYQQDFIKSNPSSVVVPVVLRSISYGLDANQLEEYLDAMDATLDENQIVKELRIRVEALKKVEIGRVAPDFTMNDVDGEAVTLSEIEGYKILLIDFWAAWCGPCRRENPNVVAVYNDFHKAGFDVLGVSLDNEKEAWLKAISDDQLTWTHVSDLGGWSNSAAKLYAVNSIPANFLIDAEGKIIAKGLRGEDLRAEVERLLSEE